MMSKLKIKRSGLRKKHICRNTKKNLEHQLNEKCIEVKIMREKLVNQKFVITTRDRMLFDFQENTFAEARNMVVSERKHIDQ